MRSTYELQTSDFVEHIYGSDKNIDKISDLQFVSWSHNIQILLDDGNAIIISQGNSKVYN